MAPSVPVALTIAGSDPSGGAGIQADLKTFHEFRVYGEAVVTLITVQNTRGVQRVECLPADLVEAQIRAVVEDIPPLAVKIGALGNSAIIASIASLAQEFELRLILDPVMISKHGSRLLAADACDILRERLLPLSYVLTPNLEEASALTGMAVRDLSGMRRAAEALVKMGATSVVIKGGHLADTATDILLHEGECYEFPAPRIDTVHTHGTGCTYSAAITACLAKGFTVLAAVETAKSYIQEAIRTNPGLGHGSGPVNQGASCAPPGPSE